MPYVEGESLRDRLQRDKQLSIDAALALTSQVLSALDYAHKHGVVHRDIKPENILIAGEHGFVADFGIARALDAAGGEKLTETGLALGTPAYMSPEQAAGDGDVDPRSDLYGVGCVLYEMLVGQPPFTGPTARAIMARHSLEAVPPIRIVRATVPEAVDAAITKALAKVPADRFASAAEFSLALTSPTSAARRPRRVLPRMIRWAVPVGAGVLVAGATGAWLVLHSRGPKILPSASRIAVLPLAPSVADTALTRLGRDLVFTVSANLDDVGEIRTVDAHTILAQSASPRPGVSLPNAAALGRRFGAGSVVHGSIARMSPRLVRLDFGLFTSDSLTPIARASVTASPDSVAVLSDSITRALLQHIWRRGEPPTPSLDAALKTRSVPALRAFLEGERALVENRWDDAAEAYASAISADSTFWLPYWRYAFSRGYWEGNDIDSVVVKAFQTHRADLPPADRLSIESFMAVRDSFSVAVARAKEVTQRFPDYWFGWLVYGDYLVHRAPILGFRVAEAGPVLERALQLNPRLVPAWEHLIWVYCKRRDPAGAIRALEALGRLGAGPSLESAEGFDELVQFRLLARLAETGGKADRALIDSVARTSAKGGGAGGGLLGWCGFRQAQAEISRQVLRLGPAPDVAARHRRFLAFTWASRGAWDSVSGGVGRAYSASAERVVVRRRRVCPGSRRRLAWRSGRQRGRQATSRGCPCGRASAGRRGAARSPGDARLARRDAGLGAGRLGRLAVRPPRARAGRPSLYQLDKRTLGALARGLSTRADRGDEEGRTGPSRFGVAACRAAVGRNLRTIPHCPRPSRGFPMAARGWRHRAGSATPDLERGLGRDERQRGGRRVRQPRVPRASPNRGFAR